jgi:hypothetical protein
MKNGSNTKISNKFCLFPHDHDHDHEHEHNTEKCHAFKSFFWKKNPKHENKKDCIFDDLFDIK